MNAASSLRPHGAHWQATFDTFLPAFIHPMNAVLETDGLHFTGAAPKTSTLTLTKQTDFGTAAICQGKGDS